MQDAPYDIEDLNWALHAIEQREDDPHTSIDDYRMPGNPRLYDIPDDRGILNPEIIALERRTGPSTAQDIEFLKKRLILEAASKVAGEIATAPLPPLYYYARKGQ